MNLSFIIKSGISVADTYSFHPLKPLHQLSAFPNDLDSSQAVDAQSCSCFLPRWGSLRHFGMEPASPQLSLLASEILVQICRFVDQIPEENHRQAVQHPLRPLSLVNKRLREICTPRLFRRSSVTVYSSWVEALPWLSTLATVTWMDGSLVLGGHVKYEFLSYFRRIYRRCLSLSDEGVRAFNLRIEINYQRAKECFAVTRAPPETLPQLLARVLARTTSLEQLAFKLPVDRTAIFAAKFAEAQLVLPLVRKLDIANMCGFMVKICPNVKEVRNWRSPMG